MYPMFKHSSRYVLMIIIMAFGMMFSSMGTFASHGTNGLVGSETNYHTTGFSPYASGHSHDTDVFPSGSSGHNSADHFHETPEQLPTVEIPLTPVADGWQLYPEPRTPVKTTDIIYRPPSTREI
ncbi:hypothetical protein LF934_17215 [Dickeya dadantii]|uniref:hypothetical protein n=1 Tax=Dickeya dadantii TaxID=204038 RepID=UPI001CF17A86|nr:hypothetical protein [Dickeya dadantii]MCA7014375.1 hypothetical protein [Dickeya dadantii]